LPASADGRAWDGRHGPVGALLNSAAAGGLLVGRPAGVGGCAEVSL
jgi:hypothetical protein